MASTPPPEMLARPGDDRLKRMNRILLRACENHPANRYPSAREMHDDFLALQKAITDDPQT